MRLALAALAALLIATPAHALTRGKVLVVRNYIGSSSTLGMQTLEGDRDFIRVTNILGQLGVDYRVAYCNQVRTEFARTGAMVWGFGTSLAHVEQFDAVLFPAWAGKSTLTGATCSGLDSDSLTLSALGGPTVPQLMIKTSYHSSSNVATQGWGVTSACTVGVTNAVTRDIPAIDGVQAPMGVYKVGSPLRFTSHSYISGYVRHSTAPAGGIRTVLGRSTADLTKVGWEGINSAQPDSMGNPEPADTLLLWVRPWSHITGAKPQIFCFPTGKAPCPDSSAAGINESSIPCEGEFPILLAGIAMLDSAVQASGKYLMDRSKLPLRVAPLIVGGFSRSGRRHPGGLFAPDSAALKTSIDSLATYGIKATLAANMDSVSTNRRDWDWWSNWKELRVAPVTRWGLDSAVAGLGNWSPVRPVDAFGRWRSRQAYRAYTELSPFDSTCALAADSSINCSMRWLRAQADSAFQGRTSRVAVAPDDDYTPINFRSPVLADSVLYALSKAGFIGVVQNGQWLDANPQQVRTNTRGWFYQQQGRWINGSRFKVLTHSGYAIQGGIRQYDVRADSAAPYVPTTSYAESDLITREQQRVWHSLLHDRSNDYDFNQFDLFDPAAGAGADENWEGVNRAPEDKRVGYRRASVMRLSVNDLAGPSSGEYGPAPRWGAWALKSLKNSFDIINSLCGTNVVVFSYLDEVNP